jgi:hypothetical protein
VALMVSADDIKVEKVKRKIVTILKTTTTKG